MMDDRTSKRSIIAVCVIVAIVTVIGAFGWFIMSDSAKSFYYVQVDNAKITDLESEGRAGIFDPNGGMSYSYTLPAYSKDGKTTEISFGTERQLREDAYLSLEVLPIRGVVAWKEVRFDELPVKVQDRLRE